MSRQRYSGISQQESLEVQRLQDRWQQFVTSFPMASGTLLKDITPSADGAVTIVPHKLGRKYRNWMVVGQNYDGVELDIIDTGNDISYYIGNFRTEAHDCGGVPEDVVVKLECTSGDVGFSVGNIVYLQSMGAGSSYTSHYGLTLQATSSSIGCVIATTGGIGMPNTSGAAATWGSTSWDVIFEVHKPRRLQEVTDSQTDADPTKYIYFRGHGFTGSDKVDLWVW